MSEPISPVPGLSPAELERLAWLSEEMGEAIHVIGKILRHGFDSAHPDYEEVPNRLLLTKELGHVWAAMRLLLHVNDISAAALSNEIQRKLVNVQPYLHYNSTSDIR